MRIFHILRAYNAPRLSLSPSKNITSYPPPYHCDENSPDDPSRIYRIVKLRITQTHQRSNPHHQDKRNKNHHHCVITPSCREVPVEQRMDCPLASATGTLQPGDNIESTFREKSTFRIERPVNDNQSHYRQSDNDPDYCFRFHTHVSAIYNIRNGTLTRPITTDASTMSLAFFEACTAPS